MSHSLSLLFFKKKIKSLSFFTVLTHWADYLSYQKYPVVNKLINTADYLYIEAPKFLLLDSVGKSKCLGTIKIWRKWWLKEKEENLPGGGSKGTQPPPCENSNKAQSPLLLLSLGFRVVHGCFTLAKTQLPHCLSWQAPGPLTVLNKSELRGSATLEPACRMVLLGGEVFEWKDTL